MINTTNKICTISRIDESAVDNDHVFLGLELCQEVDRFRIVAQLGLHLLDPITSEFSISILAHVAAVDLA